MQDGHKHTIQSNKTLQAAIVRSKVSLYRTETHHHHGSSLLRE